MDVYLDYARRLEKIRSIMRAEGLDLFIGTRTKSLTYVAGAFIPWRSTVLVSRDGYVGLNAMLIDQERMRRESWLDNIAGYAPIPGFDLWDLTIAQIRQEGFERATIGVELGYSPRANAGYLFYSEFEKLKTALPEATFVPALSVMDRATYVKDEGEITLLRQAAAMADAAMVRVAEELCVGITETEIAGIGEQELRRLGSEYHWAVTGSSEVASGERICYAMNATTPPSRRLVQPGDNVLADFHPCYRLYCSDLAHNFILGRPTAAQLKLADAYVQTAETLVASLKAGNSVGQVHRAVMEKVETLGYAACTIPSFGHGLGIMGHEWYPAIVDNDEFRDVVLEENVVEVAFLAMTVPGVCGMRLECPVLVTPGGGEMLCRTPLELTVVDV